MRHIKLFLALFLVALALCGFLLYSRVEYKKLTYQEAQTIMSRGAVILDLRSQEEFDNRHIKNAVSLPYSELSSCAENLVPDKNKPVLVYCQTGLMSAPAANELIELGYKKVYDLGGLDFWPGALDSGWRTTTYYNYFGGELPPSTIEPINLTINRRINPQMPMFEFHVKGYVRQEYSVTRDRDLYYLLQGQSKIHAITIRSEGRVIQELTRLCTANYASADDMYGFSLDDWNFDGFLDISLWQYPGGTMRNSPTYYWLWDNELGRFVENDFLGSLSGDSGLVILKGTNQIRGYTRNGPFGGISRFYEYRDGQFFKVKTEEWFSEPSAKDKDKYVMRIVTEELINGEMVVTGERYEGEY